MTKEKKKTMAPKVRFKQKDGHDFPEWEDLLLRDLAKIFTQKNKIGKISRVLTNSAVDGVVDQREFFEKDIANKSNLEGYYIVELGDYVYNPRISTSAPVGPISKNKIGVGVMSPLYTVFRFFSDQNDFFEQYFKTSHWHKYLRSISNSGARHDRISITINEFMDMPLPYPCLAEQQKIAATLTSLDDLISAQSEKIKALQTHKKGLMQQLFPAEGERAPRVRFKEFEGSGEWEIIALEKITHKIMVGIASAATHAYRTSGVILFRNQNIKDGYLDDKELLFIDKEYEKVHKNKRLKAGDLLIARTGYPGAACVVPKEYEGSQSFTTLIARPNTKLIDSSFLCLYVNSELGQAFFESTKIGGGQQNVNAGSLSEMPIPYPSLNEQQKIATLLSSLDDLITTQHEKLEVLKTQKKGLMQQLFPNPNDEAI